MNKNVWTLQVPGSVSPEMVENTRRWFEDAAGTNDRLVILEGGATLHPPAQTRRDLFAAAVLTGIFAARAHDKHSFDRAWEAADRMLDADPQTQEPDRPRP